MKSRPSEWAIAVGGGLTLAALLVLALRGWDSPGGVKSPLSARLVQTAAAPPAQIAAQPVRAEPMIDMSALQLRGVVDRAAGAVAVIQTGDGRQRLVRVGAEVQPGVRLAAGGAHHIVLASGDARRSLGFGGDTAPPAAPAPTVAATDARIAALAATSAEWRLALSPCRQDNQIIGYTVIAPDRLMLLRRAGIQAGDVLTAVNGAALASDEKVIELPQEISGANAVTFAFRRAGINRSAAVPIPR